MIELGNQKNDENDEKMRRNIEDVETQEYRGLTREIALFGQAGS
jgi:hypothetical protein